ncbi:MAG: Bcr/CflA family efflux MFS transporter [Alphaproteobacteria bacterium]|nr:Bcr/CflA family efflux MFS transporter [Alphaproteobacteria bacterium]
MTDTPHRPPSLAILFLMMFASQLALTIYLPAVVNIAEDLNTSLTQVQFIIPAYLGAFAVMQLVAGPLSDAFGRRPVILGGLTLFFVASVACGLAFNIEVLLVGRFFQAMGACTTIVVGRAIIRDGSEGKSAAKSMSYMGIAMAVGPAIAPFLGGFLVSWFDWRATFFATGLVALIALIAALPRFAETLHAEMRRPPDVIGMFRNYATLARNRRFMGYSLTISFLTGTFQTFIVAAPIIMVDQMGVTPTLFGFYVMIVPTTFMVASYITGILGKWVPLDQLIALGCAIAIAGGLIQFGFAVSGASTPITILTAILISNFGTGLAFANCYGQSLSAVSPSVAGAGSALTGFVHMGWAFLISFGLASIDDINVVDLGISQTATTLASTTAFIFLVWFVRPQSNA